MQKFKDLIRDEFSGWKPFDIIWLVTVSVVITVMSILFKYDKAKFRVVFPQVTSTAVKQTISSASSIAA